MDLTEEHIEGESWRIFVRTGQKYFPAKQRKDISEKMCLGIRVVVFRLNEETLIRRFDSEIHPILGMKDPLALKLIRDSHTKHSISEGAQAHQLFHQKLN